MICCYLCGVCCLLFGVFAECYCLLCVVCRFCLLFLKKWLLVVPGGCGLLLVAVRCLVFVVCCYLVSVVWRLLFVARCCSSMSGVSCLLVLSCCVLFVRRCFMNMFVCW